MSKPLITFALISYNQERFIREAVRGALAQTYSPLQIILSDDCSQDKTFAIIQEEVSDYEGPHQILLNRNERNLGLGGNVSRVSALAKGELIVIAAGDDVSLPSRTEELVRVWSKGDVSYVHSNFTIIDEDKIGGESFAYSSPWLVESPREIMRDLIRDFKWPGIFGCTAAWDRAAFDTFGSLPEGNVHEDYLIPLRSALLGKSAYVDKSLVKFRRHSANTSKMKKQFSQMDLLEFAKYELSQAQTMCRDYESVLHDIPLFLSAHPEPKMEKELLQAMESTTGMFEYYELEASLLKEFVEGSSTGRWRSCWRSIRLAKNVKKIGIKRTIKATIKLCALSIWPATFLKWDNWRLQRLSAWSTRR